MSRTNVSRLIVLFVVMCGLALLAYSTPISKYLEFETLQQTMRDAGFLGILLFQALFILGILMNLPGFLFIVPVLLVYGFKIGIPIVYVGTLFAVTIHFIVIRTIGGKMLGEIKKPIIRKMMAKLEEHPIRVVAILRLLLFISPPANYALALSTVRFSDFFIGTLIGISGALCFITAVTYFAKDMVIGWLQ